MKKLLLVCISGLVLAACGDNYNSITIKEFLNDKTVQEQEKIGEWLKGELSATQLSSIGSLAMSCSKQLVEMKAQMRGKPATYPEECNQTLGDFIKKNK